LEDSTLAAAETAAKLSFVLETDLDPTVDLNGQYVTADDGFGAFDTITLPKTNAGLTLPSGFKVSQLKAEQPTTAYSPFKTDCLIGVGAAIGEPRNIVLNDSSSYNYSSARLDAQVFERWAATIQTICVKILDSHFKTIMSVAADNPAVTELLSRYSLDAIPFSWYFAAPTHIDRQKEASADVMLLKNNCMSLRDYYAKQGRDWRAELEQIAAERRLMQELGITPEDIVTAEQEQQEVVEQ
ncbi:MAG: phage portal protein, partial [Ruminococcus sp.]|nr:phage portal protein [Ruminococcus sp.]